MTSGPDDPKHPIETAETIKPIRFRPGGRTPRRRTPTIWRWVIGGILAGVFFALIVSVWFVFTARQVILAVEPPPDSISIQGGLPAPRWGDYFLIRPGEYVVRAVKSCYTPLNTTITVSREKSQRFTFPLTRLPGTLSLAVHQKGAPEKQIDNGQVVIDGEPVGSTPLHEYSLSAGAHRLKIQAERYQVLETDLVVDGCGKLQVVDLAMIPGWSDVTISSIPSGADVRVGGKSMGRTPLTLQLPAGTHELQVIAERFKPWHESVTLVANKPRRFETIRLEQADGRLRLNSTPAGANVMIGNQYAGQTPLEVDLAYSEAHTVQLSKSGYETAVRNVTIASAQSKTVNVTLEPITGLIRFTVKPTGAQLVVNGKARGPVPKELKLVAASQQIEIRKTGYRTYRTRITPRPGFPQEINISLEPVGASKKESGTSAVVTAPNGYVLKLIRPGAYTMGASRREQGRRSNETLRRIELKRPFYMGLNEVTNKEFRAFEAGHDSGTFKTVSLNRDEQPVVNITWEQAVRYCNYLSRAASLPPAYVNKNGRMVAADPLTTGYRLPTEAEWEYCGRIAGNTAPFKYPWGSRFPPPPRSGNFADVSSKDYQPNFIDNYDDSFPAAAPAGSFAANAAGLFDMGGNVAEWCHDVYSIYRADSSGAVIDPAGPTDGQLRVVRGSSWRHAGISPLRLSYRDYSGDKRHDLGFRVCRYAR